MDKILKKYTKEHIRLANLMAKNLYGKTIDQQLSAFKDDKTKHIWFASAVGIGKLVDNGDLDTDELTRDNPDA